MKQAQGEGFPDRCAGGEAVGLRERLESLAEPEYAAFTRKLIPTLAPERVLGVRSAVLRALARELRGTSAAEAFLEALPHHYQEENLLHAYLLGFEKDPDRALTRTEAFLPWVDNWAVCDCLSLPCLRKHRDRLLAAVSRWLDSGASYTVRFGIKQLMDHFLEEDFRPEILAMAGALRGQEYYVNMMQAWFFATALAKQWEQTLPWLEEQRLDPWVHSRAIRKAVESFRIPEARKELLRSLRRPE